MADVAKIPRKVTFHMAECSSVSAAFPEETLMEQQIDFNNPAVSSECESLESSNMNINTCTFQSGNVYTHEGTSNDLDADGRGNETEPSAGHLKNEIRILTNKVKLLQSKLSRHRKDKKKMMRIKQRLGKSFCTIKDLCS